MRTIQECNNYLDTLPDGECDQYTKIANEYAADLMQAMEDMTLESQVAFLASWLGKLQAIDKRMMR